MCEVLVYIQHRTHPAICPVVREQIGIPVYSIYEANVQLSGGSPVIYFIWAGSLQTMSKAIPEFCNGTKSS